MDLLSSYRQMKAHVSASKAWLFFAMGNGVLLYSRMPHSHYDFLVYQVVL
jgi:hypothetical protein